MSDSNEARKISAESQPVLHIDTGLDLRGGQRQVLLLMIALREAGRASILAAPPKAELAGRAAEEGFPLLPFKAAGDIDLFAALRLSRSATQVCPSLWHAHTARAHSVAALALRLRGRSPAPRLLVTRRTAFTGKRGRLHRAKYSSPRIAHYFAISRAVAAELKALGVVQDRITIVPSAVDAAHYGAAAWTHLGEAALPEPPSEFDPERRGRLRAELGAGESDFLVGAAGALDASKGFMNLVRAAESALRERPELRFIIAGEGPERQTLEDKLAEAGLSDRFKLLGKRGDMPQLFEALDLFCMPSLAEGLGSVVLEAFAAGVPVVASDAGGLVDLVEPSITGLRFPAGDEEALSRCLVTASVERERGRDRAGAALRRLVDDFSPARMALAVETVYASLETDRGAR